MAALKRELSGARADKLAPEREDQLKTLNKHLQEQAQRPGPMSDQVLEREDRAGHSRRQRRGERHPLPTIWKPRRLRSNLKIRPAPVAASRWSGLGQWKTISKKSLLPKNGVRHLLRTLCGKCAGGDRCGRIFMKIVNKLKHSDVQLY